VAVQAVHGLECVRALFTGSTGSWKISAMEEQ
jgi:hypothetical protein